MNRKAPEDDASMNFQRGRELHFAPHTTPKNYKCMQTPLREKNRRIVLRQGGTESGGGEATPSILNS